MMWSTILARLLARPWARWAAGVALAALPRGWKHWSATMQCNARCWTQPASALAAVMILLNGCARVGFEAGSGACPPVVAYSQVEQARMADELAELPKDALTVGWLADYALLRDQVRACR